MVRFVIVAFNCPQLIRTQMRAIETYCQHSYEIEVINNGKGKYHNLIKAECLKDGIECVNVPNCIERLNPSQNHGEVLDWYVRNYPNNGHDVVFLDHDILPFQPFNLYHIFCDKIGFGMKQYNAHYKWLWPGFLGIGADLWGDLSFSVRRHKDTGPGWDWSDKAWQEIYAPHAKIIMFDTGLVQDSAFEIIENQWIHLIAMSEWKGKMSSKKAELCEKVLDSIQNDSLSFVGDKLIDKRFGEIV